MYSCCNWCKNVGYKIRISLCLNRSIRRIFGYYDFESVKDIFCFCILPIDMYIVKAHLLLVSAALRSNSLT